MIAILGKIRHLLTKQEISFIKETFWVFFSFIKETLGKYHKELTA